MNPSTDIRPRTVLAYIAMLFVAMVTTLLLPAYGQEIAPDWYDPYAVANTAPIAIPSTAAVHSAPSPVSFHQYQPAGASVSSAQAAEKFHGKRYTAALNVPSVGVLTDPKQKEKGGPIARRRDLPDIDARP
jgi:hypothetical protein